MLLLLRILNKARLLQYINLCTSCKINGVYFRIPVIGTIGMVILSEREAWMKVVLNRIIPQTTGKTFIDVGVNLGQTLLAVKSVTLQTDYVGFEPNPLCVHYTNTLIKKNNLGPVKIIPTALGDNNGLAVLYRDMNDAVDSSATIVKGFREISDRFQSFVPVTSNIPLFDQVSVGVIKIDVEGGELEVIKCLEHVIHRDHPFLICEILPVYSAENVFRLERQNQLLQLMNTEGYALFRITNTGSLITLSGIEIHSNVENSNYLFVHRDKLPMLF